MTPQVHARIVLDQIRRVALEGLPECYANDVDSWLCDLYADLPWSQDAWAEAARLVLEHPEFEALNRIIGEKYGEDIAADLRDTREDW